MGSIWESENSGPKVGVLLYCPGKHLNRSDLSPATRGKRDRRRRHGTERAAGGR